jgi:hypothetical protein
VFWWGDVESPQVRIVGVRLSHADFLKCVAANQHAGVASVATRGNEVIGSSPSASAAPSPLRNRSQLEGRHETAFEGANRFGRVLERHRIPVTGVGFSKCGDLPWHGFQDSDHSSLRRHGHLDRVQHRSARLGLHIGSPPVPKLRELQ